MVPLLLEQITAPVRWEESMGVIASSGVTDAIEFGCGPVLMGLMRRIYRNDPRAAAEDLASLKAISQAARRRQSLTARLASAAFSPYAALIT